MDKIEQVDEEFNVKKPKKKGLIITVAVILLIIVALALLYFLIFAKPQFIFSKAIDNLFKTESKQYNSVKFDSKMNISLESEDENTNQQLEQIGKCSLQLGTQIDYDKKQEIVNLGLKYDDDSVIDAQLYYDNQDIYTYFEGLFDKYIKVETDQTQKEQLEAIFKTINSENQNKNSEEIMHIIKNELKTQINEEGKFEKGKTTIEIANEDKNVTKSTLTLSQKELYNVISNICTNLSENEKFLNCFEKKSPKDGLKELANEIEKAKVNDNNSIKISIYTTGLLNKFVGLEIEVYSAKEGQTVTLTTIKEDKNIYDYNISLETNSVKANVIKGKVEIKEDESTENKETGKILITIEIPETGKATLTMDYSTEFNNGIDKIDVTNSINMEEITEGDMQSIIEKLMERPLIGDLIKAQMYKYDIEEYEDSITDGTDDYSINDLMLDEPQYITDVPNAQ